MLSGIYATNMDNPVRVPIGTKCGEACLHAILLPCVSMKYRGGGRRPEGLSVFASNFLTPSAYSHSPYPYGQREKTPACGRGYFYRQKNIRHIRLAWCSVNWTEEHKLQKPRLVFC